MTPEGLGLPQAQLIVQEMHAESERYAKEHVFFLVAAGVAAEVIAHKAHQLHGHKDTIVDIGSSLDHFAGVMSRDYSPKAKDTLCSEAEHRCFAKEGVCT